MKYTSDLKLAISHVFAIIGTSLTVYWFWMPDSFAFEVAEPWLLTAIWVVGLIIGLVYNYFGSSETEDPATSIFFGLFSPAFSFFIALVWVYHWTDGMHYTKKRVKSHLWATGGAVVAIYIIWIIASATPDNSGNTTFWITTGIWGISLILLLFLDLKEKEESDVVNSFISGVVSPLTFLASIVGLIMRSL